MPTWPSSRITSSRRAAAATTSGDGAGAAADRAARYAREAGDQALRSLAFEEASRLYRMALAVLEHHAPDSDAARLEVLLRLGDAVARGGDLPRSRETFLVAADLARRTGAAEALARAALGYGGRFFWARAGHDPHLIPMLQDALVILGGTNDGLRARLLTRLACAWRSDRERQEQRRAMSQQAIDLARTLGDPATLSYTLAGFFWAAWLAGQRRRAPGGRHGDARGRRGGRRRGAIDRRSLHASPRPHGPRAASARRGLAPRRSCGSRESSASRRSCG